MLNDIKFLDLRNKFKKIAISKFVLLAPASLPDLLMKFSKSSTILPIELSLSKSSEVTIETDESEFGSDAVANNSVKAIIQEDTNQMLLSMDENSKSTIISSTTSVTSTSHNSNSDFNEPGQGVKNTSLRAFSFFMNFFSIQHIAACANVEIRKELSSESSIVRALLLPMGPLRALLFIDTNCFSGQASLLQNITNTSKQSSNGAIDHLRDKVCKPLTVEELKIKAKALQQAISKNRNSIRRTITNSTNDSCDSSTGSANHSSKNQCSPRSIYEAARIPLSPVGSFASAFNSSSSIGQRFNFSAASLSARKPANDSNAVTATSKHQSRGVRMQQKMKAMSDSQSRILPSNRLLPPPAAEKKRQSVFRLPKLKPPEAIVVDEPSPASSSMLAGIALESKPTTQTSSEAPREKPPSVEITTTGESANETDIAFSYGRNEEVSPKASEASISSLAFSSPAPMAGSQGLSQLIRSIIIAFNKRIIFPHSAYSSQDHCDSRS